MSKLFKYILVVSLFFAILSCSQDYQGPVPYPTLIEAANEAGLTDLVTPVRVIPGLETMLGTEPEIGQALLYVGGATGIVGTVVLFKGLKKISLGPPVPGLY